MVNGNRYNVMLEDLDGENGYFKTYEVFADTHARAKEIAYADAAKSGLNIISCKEVEGQSEFLETHSNYGVLKRYGKSYFEE